MQGRKRSKPVIGVDLHVVDGMYQGSRTHCIELFSRVIAITPEIDFVGFCANPESFQYEHSQFVLPNLKLCKIRHGNPAFRLLYELPRLVDLNDVDLLHTQYISPPFCRCPTSVTVHDVLFETHPEYFETFFTLRSKLLVRRSARRSRQVFTVSSFSRNEISSRYGIDQSRITVIPNGVDNSRFFTGGVDSELLLPFGLRPRTYLLTVGRLEPRKNHLNLLRAYDALPRPRPKLVVVGQRDFGYREIFAASRKLPTSDVVFLDSVPDVNLGALYRHALIFVYPTWAEGFGMPVIEAMASGVPVVTSNTTCLPEIAGEAAVYADPSDCKSIGRALGLVLNDASLRDNLISLGLKRASKFTWDRSAKQVRLTYLEMFGIPQDSGKVEKNT